MTGGKDEAVAIEPLGLSRIALQRAAEENCADFSCAEGEAKVAGVALVDGVHGESTGFVGGFLKEVVVHR